MSNFTPEEIRKQATGIRNTVEDFNKHINQMIITIHKIEVLINDGKIPNGLSNFPSVGSELASFEGSYISIQAAILNNFRNLASVIEKWADDTEEAEAVFTTKIRGLSENIEAINAMLALLTKA